MPWQVIYLTVFKQVAGETQPAPVVTHPVLNVLQVLLEVVVGGASVQDLAAHFEAVPALHFPSNPVLVRQSDPSVRVDGI